MCCLLLLVVGFILVLWLWVFFKCVMSFLLELKGVLVLMLMFFVFMMVVVMVVDFLFGGFDFFINMSYMLVFVSFFIFFSFDLVFLFWKIYLWVFLIWLGVFLLL